MRKVLLYVGFGGIVVSVLVMAICSAFGGRGSSVAEEQVSVNVPEGVAVPSMCAWVVSSSGASEANGAIMRAAMKAIAMKK